MNVLAPNADFSYSTYRVLAPQPLPSISIIGLGYVGAVSTACLAGLGHRVVGCDVDAVKVSQIADGESPIHEDGLQCLLTKGVEDSLISTTTSAADAVEDTDVTFVSVGTPTSETGGCDYRFVIAAARAIGEGISRKDDFHVVVMRCSVPPRTTMEVMVPQIEDASGKKLGEGFGICFNPEFLREGTAIADFDNPPKTVIGASDEHAARIVSEIYRPVDDNPIVTTIDAAEMVKYVDNVWHATKVSFANEIGRICKPLGIDSHEVMDIFVQDTKLNLSPYYLKPGFAFGGSCLPKEVRAVDHLSRELGVHTPLIGSLSTTNKLQIEEAIEMVRATGSKKVGFLGLAFKPGTDDLRESPILEVINTLMQEGTAISAYDPVIRLDTRIEEQFRYVSKACPHLEKTICGLQLLLEDCGHSVVDNSEVVVVAQNCPEIRQLIASRMGKVQIIDLVRLFPEKPMFDGYAGIGW